LIMFVALLQAVSRMEKQFRTTIINERTNEHTQYLELKPTTLILLNPILERGASQRTTSQKYKNYDLEWSFVVDMTRERFTNRFGSGVGYNYPVYSWHSLKCATKTPYGSSNI